MQGKVEKEELPVYRTPNELGKVIHIVAWGILFGIPFFFTGHEMETVTIESYMRFIIVPISFMFVFYVNYFFLVPKYLFTRRLPEFFVANVLLIVFTMVAVHLLMDLLPDQQPHEHHYRELPNDRPHRKPPMEEEPPFRNIIGFFLGNVMMYMLVSGLSVAIRVTGNWYQMESMRRDLEQSRVEAELRNLKSQLNPHFLFNTLNNIYCLIAFSPDRAQGVVHDLSRLLRYVLYDSNQKFVPLEKELDFIRNYVELMRIRLPEHVSLDLQINGQENEGGMIAPLLFISLIENAFKHGVSNNLPSFIRICITCDKTEVHCRIENSYFPKNGQDKSGSGIGLVNLKKRLELIYPASYSFRYGQEGDTYIADLQIQTGVK